MPVTLDMEAELDAVVEAYRRQFGETPGVWEYRANTPGLIAALREAVARGEPVDGERLFARLGLTPPPDGVEL